MTDYRTESRDFHTFRPHGLTLQEALKAVGILATAENITQISRLSSRDRIRMYVYINQYFTQAVNSNTAASCTLHWFLVWVD